jgi:hypothetical protein
MSKHDLELLEASRKTLITSTSSLQDCVTAAAIVANARREAETALQVEEAARIRTLSSSHSKASDLDSALQAHDDRSAMLRRRAEIASATEVALLNRINGMRAAQDQEQRAADYEAAKNALMAYVEEGPQVHADMIALARPWVKRYGQIELAIGRVNAALPPGAPPLPSIESFRRSATTPNSTKVIRRARGYIDQAGRVLGLEGELDAKPSEDGRLTVAVGVRSPFTYVEVTLADLVEVEIVSHPDGGWMEQLPRSLSIPAWRQGQPDGWSDDSDRRAPIYPDAVLNRLAHLEVAEPAPAPQPQTTRRLVPASVWDKAQAEAV